jgi:hypothetical protein
MVCLIPVNFDYREAICVIQGKDPNDGYQTEIVEEDELPMPTYDNLGHIVEELSNLPDMMRKRKISSFILQENVSSLNPV